LNRESQPEFKYGLSIFSALARYFVCILIIALPYYLDEHPIGATRTVATFGQLRLFLALLTYLADLGGDNLKNFIASDSC
jgi:hypothetical protein